jgi:hypothetical protein
VVDPDLDPNFYFDADPDTDWHQNDAGLRILHLLLFTTMPVYNVFPFLIRKWQRCHVFKYFGQHIENFWKTVKNTSACKL